MTLLNIPADFQWMRQVQDSAMHDQCRLVFRVENPGPYNEPIVSFDPADELIICGYDPKGGKYQMSSTEVVSYDSVFRLPHGTILDQRGGLILEMQAGAAVDPLSFELVGPPDYGPTAILVRARSVTDGRF